MKAQFDETYCPIIWQVVSSIQKQSDPLMEKILKETLKVILQKYTNFPTRMASQKAIDLIETTKKAYNPFYITWNQRTLFGKVLHGKSERNAIMWEHVITLSESIHSLIACRSEQDVLLYLQSYPGTCLITRAEDDLLNKKHKSQRTEGWQKVYAQLDIQIVNRSSYFPKP